MPKGHFIGEFELYVLLAIVHLGDEAYGLAIRRKIADRTDRDTAIGAVYATLARLADKELVTAHLSEPRPVSGGRARKCFRLTSAGEKALRHSTSALAQMMEVWTAGGRHS
jgi:PadR family transcriptional regulator